MAQSVAYMLLSILIPLYNEEKFIESVLNG